MEASQTIAVVPKKKRSIVSNLLCILTMECFHILLHFNKKYIAGIFGLQVINRQLLIARIIQWK